MKLRNLMLVALSFMLFVLVALQAYYSHEIATELYGRVSFYLIFALFLAWVGVVAGYLRRQGFLMRAFLRKQWIILGMAALTTGTVFNSVDCKFRVLSDETNLISISQGMLYYRTVFNNTMNKRYFGNMNALTYELEKRPLMFPFFIYLVHLVRGYDYRNAFIVNALALFGLLTVVGLASGAWLGPLAGVSAILLVAAYPLVTSVATSAGFDLLATFFTALLFALLYHFFRAPNSDRFALLWINLLVFSHIRYESALIVTVLLGGILIFRKFRLDYIVDRPGVYIASPFLLLPLVCQRILIPHPYENGPGVPAFSLDHFSKFFSLFLDTQTNFGFSLPHAILLNWIAVPVALFGLTQFFLGRVRPRKPEDLQPFLIMGAAMLLSLGIFFFYYFGDYTHPASVRFFLGISVLAALSPILLHALLPRHLTSPRLFILALGAFVLYHPVSVQGRFTNIQTLIRETDAEIAFLQRLGRRDVLVITSRPGQLGAMDYGAVDFNYANNNRDGVVIELKRHLYNEIYVMQRTLYDTLKPMDADRLDPQFKLETVYEIQTSAVDFLRISRVKPEPLEPRLEQTPTSR